MKLRHYQIDVINDSRSAMATGCKRVLIQLPTGGGKTVVASDIIKRAVTKNRRTLFLAHRRELITQAAAKLEAFGVTPGILMAGHKALPHRQVQVGSIQTLDARVLKREQAMAAASDEEQQRLQAALDVGGFDLIFIDEAHRSLGATYLKALARWPNAYVIGLTATPARKDGRGLGHVYDWLVQGPTVQELIDDGSLVPLRYFRPVRLDLSAVQVKAGDYVAAQLETAVNTSTLVADIVESWSKHGRGRQTVVFASGVKHSMALAERFKAAGIAAAHLDGETPKDERDFILWQLSEGHLQVVCNCDVLTEGWDCPIVSCIVLAKPTKSVVKYLQMAGRALRPEQGKVDCVILDHANVIEEHGLVEADRDWSLHTKGKKDKKQGKVVREEPQPCVCENCAAIFARSRECPNCGAVRVKRGKDIGEDPGELVEGKTEAPADRKTKKQTELEQKAFFAQLLDYARLHGKKDAWAIHKVVEKFKRPTHPWAWLRNIPAIPCGPEVHSWIRSRNIAFAKSNKKAGVA